MMAGDESGVGWYEWPFRMIGLVAFLVAWLVWAFVAWMISWRFVKRADFWQLNINRMLVLIAKESKHLDVRLKAGPS